MLNLEYDWTLNSPLQPSNQMWLAFFRSVLLLIHLNQVFDQMWPWDSSGPSCIMCFLSDPVQVDRLLTSQIQTVCSVWWWWWWWCLSCFWLQINMWILKLSGFPCPHMFLSLFLSLFSNTLLISLHSLTAWTLCCAYCSVTHLPSFFSKRVVLPKSTFFVRDVAEADFFSWNFSFCPSLALSTHCTCIKSISCDLLNTGTEYP